MSFWKGVKSAFGFGADSDEDDEEYDSSLPTYAATPRPQAIATAVATSVTASAERADEAACHVEGNTDTEISPAAVDPELPGDLFDALIEQFNAAQPDFVARCLSTEAQRAYLLNSLSEGLRRRVANAGTVSSQADREELERLQRRVNTLEGQAKGNEELRQENRKLRLSVERQKRALLDRINDLEAQVAKHHQEKEKFYTEKHHSTQASAAVAEPPVADAAAKEIEAIKGELESARGELESARAEVKRQSTLREQLEVKTAMSDEMINNLRNKAAAARKEYDDTCREQEEALEKIHEQVEAFEQVKERLESRISELKESLRREKELNASLRSTIETNLYNQANSEMKLRAELKEATRQLEELRADAHTSAANDASTVIVAQSETRADSQPRRRRGRPKKVKIDEELDNTEWFASHKDDPDFGYHEPPRRPANDDANQLTLF